MLPPPLELNDFTLADLPAGICAVWMVSFAATWTSATSSTARAPARDFSVYTADCRMSAPPVARRLTTCQRAPTPTGSTGSGVTIDSNDWLIPFMICCALGGTLGGRSSLTSCTCPFELTQ